MGDFELIAKFISLLGAPAATTGIGLFAWWQERKDNREMQAKMIEIATAAIAASMRNVAAIEALQTALFAPQIKRRDRDERDG